MTQKCKGLLGWIFGHDEVVTSQGYPAFSKVWIIYSTCQRCKQKFRTVDDLFVPERPEHLKIDLDYMSNK